MKSATRPGLRIVVLAAGLSARLGRPKGLARVHGMSLMLRTVSLSALLGAGDIICVIPPRAARTRAELRGHRVCFAENRRRADGLSASIRRGLAAARASAAVLFLPVDLVHLERRDLGRMIKRWMGAQRRVVARDLGAQGGIPLILPRWLHGRAREICGDRGLKDLVARLPHDARTLLDCPSAACDVDTAEDLARARRRWHPRRH